MMVAPWGNAPRLASNAAGFMATRTLGESPGVEMVWSEMWTWKADTPARVPAGARISAGKSGNVARSLPSRADEVVNRSPASCIPSPESPANRMTTRSIRWGDFGSMVVSDTLLLFVLLERSRASVADVPPVDRHPLGGAPVQDARRGHAAGPPRHYRRPPGTQAIVHGGCRTGPCGGPGRASGDGDLGIQVDVLDGMDEGGALVGRPLEGLAPHDQTGTARPLVDHGGSDGLGQVVGPLGLAA